MIQHKLPRIMIAGVSSGSGKTTITCGLLQALVNRQYKVAAYKCGPDYIDPMFHREVIGVASRNLDLFFTDEQTTTYLLEKNSRGYDLAVLEGVMGFYDGVAGITTRASSYHLAKATETPVILVINGKGMSLSIIAQIKGFLEYGQNNMIAAVILNQISEQIYQQLKPLIEQQLGVMVLGYIPKLTYCSLESRHLGLVTAQEIGDLKEKLEQLAQQLEQTVDVKKIVQLAVQAKPLPVVTRPSEKSMGKTVPIAIAMDEAFCFYYQDNLDLLEEMGAQLIPFRPLTDRQLPQGISGLILGGGYPELYGKQLSENQSLRQEIAYQLQQGLPCWAECGGFMYLHETMEDEQGICYPMVAAIKGRCYPTGKLQRFGYITITTQQDTLLAPKGESILGHEFHYWDSNDNGQSCLAQKPVSHRQWQCIHGNAQWFVGYPHIYLYSNTSFGAQFIQACHQWQEGRKEQG